MTRWKGIRSNKRHEFFRLTFLGFGMEGTIPYVSKGWTRWDPQGHKACHGRITPICAREGSYTRHDNACNDSSLQTKRRCTKEFKSKGMCLPPIVEVPGVEMPGRVFRTQTTYALGRICPSSQRRQTFFSSHSIVRDLGLSIGNPRARDQMSWERTPIARLVPNSTV